MLKLWNFLLYGHFCNHEWEMISEQDIMRYKRERTTSVLVGCLQVHRCKKCLKVKKISWHVDNH